MGLLGIDPRFFATISQISLSGGEWLSAVRTAVASAELRALSVRKNFRHDRQNASFFTVAPHLPHFFCAAPDTSPPGMASEIGDKGFFMARTAVRSTAGLSSKLGAVFQKYLAKMRMERVGSDGISTGSRLGRELRWQISGNSGQSWYRNGLALRPVLDLSSWPVLT